MKPSDAPCCTVFVRDVTEKGSGACDENQVVEKGVAGLWIAVPRGILRARCTSLSARVVKLVDTGDLKSPGHCGRAGSSPASGTTNKRVTVQPTIAAVKDSLAILLTLACWSFRGNI